MLWEIPLGFAALLAIATAIFIATRPATKQFSESLTIKSAAVAPLFDIVSDLRRWNPWAEWDPNATCRYLGPSHGVGAVLEWESTGPAGKGSIVITKLGGQSELSILLEEIAPTESLQVTQLHLAVQNDVTVATWSFKRRLSFWGKASAFFGIADGMRLKLKRGLVALDTRFQAEQRSAAPKRMLDCSFCGKNQREVRKLIAGPNVLICDECLKLCNDIIAEEIQKELEPQLS